MAKEQKPDLSNLERNLSGWKAAARLKGATHFEVDYSNPRQYVVTAYDKASEKDRKAVDSKTIKRN